jgi:hypothetical protein
MGRQTGIQSTTGLAPLTMHAIRLCFETLYDCMCHTFDVIWPKIRIRKDCQTSRTAVFHATFIWLFVDRAAARGRHIVLPACYMLSDKTDPCLACVGSNCHLEAWSRFTAPFSSSSHIIMKSPLICPVIKDYGKGEIVTLFLVVVTGLVWM